MLLPLVSEGLNRRYYVLDSSVNEIVPRVPSAAIFRRLSAAQTPQGVDNVPADEHFLFMDEQRERMADRDVPLKC
jgi:hypothetical protein